MSQLPILQKEILAKKCAPIKIMQFGEGNFLRAFVDWLVQKMNDSGEYDGHVVVVQPLENGRVAALAEQDGLYTLILQGLDENGVAQRPHKVIDVLDDFVNPYSQYEKYLSYAESKDLEVVISNTTEAGIAFDPEDVKRDFSKETPHSYPGKLYALLERRYEKLGKNYGLAIIPCELIDDNGDRLHEVLLELAKAKGASEGLIDFLDNSCHYTSTLVDRIVPGFPRDEFESLCEEFGYIDNNMVKGEYFHLYVLKNEPFVMQKFPVHKVGLHAIYVDDIHPYKARKVRILNGSHTALVPVAYLSGKNEVREALLDENIHGFLLNLINKETLPTISTADAPKFASDVMDRFLNPYVHHALMSIALNSTSKWKERDLPILLDDLKKGIVPHHLIFSFAALIAFYRGIRTVNGLREEIKLADNPEYLAEWQRIWTRFDREGGVQAIVDEILSKTDFWGINLLEVPSFPREELRDDLVLILQKGCYEALKEKFPRA